MSKKAKRYVRPVLDLFFAKRRMPGDKQLHISNETDDGSCWFGIKHGITAYCEEAGLSISDVEWHIYTDFAKGYDDVIIKADTVEEWVKKFNEIDPVFDVINGKW